MFPTRSPSVPQTDPSPLTITASGEVAPAGAGDFGVYAIIAGAIIANEGAIYGGAAADGSEGVGGDAVFLQEPGSLVNSGRIEGGAGGSGELGGMGGVGVSLAGGTLTNAGTISGGAGGDGVRHSFGQGDAVAFGAAPGTLVVDPGAVFSGYVVGNSAGTDSLVLGGTLASTLTGLGTQFVNFPSVVIDDGARWTVGLSAQAEQTAQFSGVSAADTFVLSGGGALAHEAAASAPLGHLVLSGADPFIMGPAYTTVAYVDLQAGTLTVRAGASITPNYAYGIVGANAPAMPALSGSGRLVNEGAIDGGVGIGADGSGSTGGVGVSLDSNAQLSNGGTILGGAGSPYINGYSGGAGGAGVDLAGSAIAINTGLIEGGAAGSGSFSAPSGGTGVNLTGSAQLSNAGTILGGEGGFAAFFSGNGGYGVSVGQGSSLTNTGTIIGGAFGGVSESPAGGEGVYLSGGVFTNAGTVEAGTGGNNRSVYIGAGGGTLSLDSGAVFDGKVDVKFQTTATLALAGSTPGTLSGLGTEFVGFSTLADTAATDWTLPAGVVFKGIIDVGTAESVAGGTTLTLAGDASGLTGTFAFDPQGDAVLQVDAGLPLAGRISDFGGANAIDLGGIDSASVTLTRENGNILQVSDGQQDSIDLHFAADDDIAKAMFTTSDDHAGGTLLMEDQIACYCRGTRVLTTQGEQAVEDLRIGDLLVTQSGLQRPLRWMGRRDYAGRFIEANPAILPILFARDAIADGVPRRDLMVSPLHAMFIDGVLIPAATLMNGVSVRRVESAAEISYFHLELDSHDVIIAEGACSETYADDGCRGVFHNAHEFYALYPDAPCPRTARFCAPRVEQGERLAAIWEKLALRAGVIGPAEKLGVLQGQIDLADRDGVRGWAFDPLFPARRQHLRVVDNGVTLGEIVADQPRPDLASAGIGDGAFGFAYRVPGGFSPHVAHRVRVLRAADSQELARSPQHLEAVPAERICHSAETPIGFLDGATREVVSGWAIDPHDVGRSVALQILDRGEVIGRVIANGMRPDVAAAGHGDGRFGFIFKVPGGLAPACRHVIEVRRERDGAPLPGSPRIVEAAAVLDAAARDWLARAVAGASEAEAADLQRFLLALARGLHQARNAA